MGHDRNFIKHQHDKHFNVRNNSERQHDKHFNVRNNSERQHDKHFNVKFCQLHKVQNTIASIHQDKETPGVCYTHVNFIGE